MVGATATPDGIYKRCCPRLQGVVYLDFIRERRSLTYPSGTVTALSARPPTSPMAEVARITLYPVKALDGEDVAAARVTDAGLLAGDREYVLRGPDGDVVNGKRTDRVHALDSAFDVEAGRLTVTGDGETATFDLPAETAAAEDWFSAFFDLEISVERNREHGFVDRRSAGPSVVSTATLEELASWYDDVTVEGMRRRLRANVEVGGVDPFWEDRFLGGAPEDASGGAPAMELGDVRLTGVEPCGRCVVPERDPGTGAHDPDFRERFVQRRRETFPAFADEDAFDHHYAAMLIAAVPAGSRGRRLSVGDPVAVVD
jgi:uncharacterized protein YcbX